MATTALTFHLPPDASLENILMLGDGLLRADDPAADSPAALLAIAAEVYELPQRSEVTSFAQRVGFLPERKPWRLTDRARGILACQAPVQRDALHYLAYTGWRRDMPTRNVPFWSYQHSADLLWRAGNTDLKAEATTLVEEVVGASRHDFSAIDGYNPDRVSYSTKSVRGILAWLRALQPPVVVGNRFTRRQTCSAQLLVLALGEAARQIGLAPGSDMLLSQDRREAICRICLIDPGSLDRLLDWTLPQFPAIVAPGMRGGSYGRSIRLLTTPTVELLCPAPESVV
jgi:hypothetical protein